MSDERAELAARALDWCTNNDGGRLGVHWPAGSDLDDSDTQPIMAVLWDNGGTDELGEFYAAADADDKMELICDLANWAMEQLAPSTLKWGTRTYLAQRGDANG